MFPELFEPSAIGTIELKNRIVMPPMGTNLASPEGFVTPRLVDYYQARAAGGVGLLIVEVACVNTPDGKALVQQIGIDDERFLPGLSKLADAIKSRGACAAIQLHHAGRLAVAASPIAPSPISTPGYNPPREMDLEDIQEMVRLFARAAGRARAAGFDAVEIHGAHQYLIAQFLSGFSNRRVDEYGGDLRGRAHFLLEVIRAVREEVGPDYPVLVRIVGREYGLDGGLNIEEAREVALWTQQAGADCLDISAYGVGQDVLAMTPEVSGFIAPFAYEVKKRVQVPVIAVGRLTPALAARLLREGRADLVAFGRALIADPELPNKVAQGRPRDITPCLRCLECLNITFYRQELRCSVNPAAGYEREYALEPASHPKKVVVVGGGPAGMEAARAAALRGHRVTLIEKSARLGGRLPLIARTPQNNRFTALKNYQAKQLKQLGVEVALRREATADTVMALHPEAVVVATGDHPVAVSKAGWAEFVSQGKVCTAREVLDDPLCAQQMGERVVVLGGGRVGCQTADYLAHRGKRVTVLEQGRRLAAREGPVLRRVLLDRLRDKGVTLLTEVADEEFAAGGLRVTDKQGGPRIIEADALVLACGRRPNAGLAEALEARGVKVYRVGDCAGPRGVLEAIAEGFHAGRTL